MTQDDVIRVTRSLGICELTSKPKQSIHYSLTIQEMLNIFNIVAEDAYHCGIQEGVVAGANNEREACAKVCEMTAPSQINGYECAEAIRERGEA